MIAIINYLQNAHIQDKEKFKEASQVLELAEKMERENNVNLFKNPNYIIFLAIFTGKSRNDERTSKFRGGKQKIIRSFDKAFQR